MSPLRLPPAAVRPSIALAGRWALSPRVDWPTRRRRVDRGPVLARAAPRDDGHRAHRRWRRR